MSCQQPELFGAESTWEPVTSGAAELVLAPVGAPAGPALRLDFDFKGGGGFVVARRLVDLSLPEAYIIRFRMRVRGPVNHFELKFVDRSGANVWRHERRNLPSSDRWREFRIPSHQIEFAWGPAGGGVLRETGAIEFAVVAAEGGRGSLWISDFRIEDDSFPVSPRATASSAVAGGGPDGAVDSQSRTAWRPAADDSRPWLTLEAPAPRETGGLTITWQREAPARGFRVRASTTGRRWKTLRLAASAGGQRSHLHWPRTRVRFIRLELRDPVGVAAVRIEPARSIDAFCHHVAAQEPRGWHPRWLHREQSLWTPVGNLTGPTRALINEEGMVEVDEGSFSIEPFVWIDGRLVAWDGVEVRQELLDGWMPVPAVIWETAGWRLRIQATAADATIHLTYRLENRLGAAIRARVFLALRPFQVTPPWQRFGNLGGVSPIHRVEWRDGAVHVNESTVVAPRTGGFRFGAMSADDGQIVDCFAGGQVPGRTGVRDDQGFASGALVFSADVAPGAALDVAVAVARRGDAFSDPPARIHTQAQWEARLPPTMMSGASWASEVICAARTAASHILVTRAGAALQPGPRRYTRSWIRDASGMGAALLRVGCVREVIDFIRWYAGFQRDDGFIPCCVDRDGPDWLVEHDSHGQFLALIADCHRFTRDREFAADLWPRLVATVGCLERLVGGDGILPVSASHEGYLAHPVHSYWDDFWAWRGLRDAAALAGALGRTGEAHHWKSLASRLGKALGASIESVRAGHHLDTIPASVEWADFDPAATANAITLLDCPPALNRQAVERTFDAYLDDWRRKRSGQSPWTRYTPYEIRIIGALVRLGRRDEALELLRFFISDRRPVAWNQWPEIAWHDPAAPAHIGDIPHTWISAEYVLAVHSLFAYESESMQSLVLAAGVAPEWLDGDGVSVCALPTAYGRLTYSLRRAGDGALHFDIGGGLERATHGIVLRPPLAVPARYRIDGGPSQPLIDGEVRLPAAPAHLIITVSAVD